MKKAISYSIICLIIGAFLGGLFGLIEVRNQSKTAREKVINYALVIGVVIGSTSGAVIGYKIGQSEDIDEVLGHNSISTVYNKYGKFWVARSEWTSKEDEKSYILMTGKSTKDFLLTELNERPIVLHDTSSGSKLNVEKYHTMTLNNVLAKIKSNYKSGSTFTLDELFPTLE